MMKHKFQKFDIKIFIFLKNLLSNCELYDFIEKVKDIILNNIFEINTRQILFNKC